MKRKFLCLSSSGFNKYARKWKADTDYSHELNDEEKEFLHKFNRSFLGFGKKEDDSEDWFSAEERRELYNQNYASKCDIMDGENDISVCSFDYSLESNEYSSHISNPEKRLILEEVKEGLKLVKSKLRKSRSDIGKSRSNSKEKQIFEFQS